MKQLWRLCPLMGMQPDAIWHPQGLQHLDACMPHVHPACTLLPMGAKCGTGTCCALWVQRSLPGWGLFERSFRVGSRETRLPPINDW